MVESIEEISPEQQSMVLPRHTERSIDTNIDILNTITKKRVASKQATAEVCDSRRAEGTCRQLLTQVTYLSAQHGRIGQGRSEFRKSIKIEIAKTVAIEDCERCAL